MRIESISRVGNKTDKYSVLFDNGDDICASVAQIADFGLHTGLELSDEDYARVIEGVKLGSAKARAMRILGNRSLSATEMERRLVGKGETQEIARATVEWLVGIGAINDDEYAAAIVRHYCSKGYGIARIRDELYRRGIPRDIWDDALSGVDGMADAADEFLRKRLGGSRDKDDLRRAADALFRRGFSYDEARDAVNRFLESYEETEEI